MKVGRFLLQSTALVGLSISAVTANAALSIVSTTGGAPTAGVIRWNFDNGTLGPNTLTKVGDAYNGDATITFATNAQFVSGSVGGQYAAPFLSGNNGIGFGNPGNQALGPDATVYVTSGSTGAVTTAMATITFTVAQQYLGLLWGSIDDYNTLTFYNGSTQVGVLTGANVTATPNGDQGTNGTRYVNINSTLAFDRVTFTSTQFAFEFDNVAYGKDPLQVVPIPAAAWLLGSGLLGLLGIGRRRVAS